MEEGNLRPNELKKFTEQSESLRMTPVSIFVCPTREHHGLIVASEKGDQGVTGDYVAMSSTFVLEGKGGEIFDGALIYGNPTFTDTTPEQMTSLNP